MLTLGERKWENNPSYWLEKIRDFCHFAVPAAFPYLFLEKSMTNPYVTFLLISFITAAYLGIILFYLVGFLGYNPKFLGNKTPSRLTDSHL